MTKIEKQYPPQIYLTKCERSSFSGKTYGEVVSFLITVIQERDLCARQIEMINEWKDKTE